MKDDLRWLLLKAGWYENERKCRVLAIVAQLSAADGKRYLESKGEWTSQPGIVQAGRHCPQELWIKPWLKRLSIALLLGLIPNKVSEVCVHDGHVVCVRREWALKWGFVLRVAKTLLYVIVPRS